MSQNTTYISPQWLLPKQPNMHCRSQVQNIAMLAVYNIISVIISYTFATPFFFSQFQRLRENSACCIGWFYQKCRRRKISDRWLAKTQKDEEQYSLSEVLFTIIGSIVIALSAPLFAGLSLYINHGRKANLWWMIQQWSTRPRPTCLLVVAQARQAWIQGNEICAKRSRSALLCSVTAMITDLFVGSLGLSLLRTEYKRSFPKSTSEIPESYFDMKASAQALYVYSIMAICAGGLIILLLLPLPLMVGDRKVGLFTIWYIFWIFLWIPLVIGYAFSWRLWANFLKSITGEMYCIEASSYIDAVYCALPIALGIWRLAWAASR